MTIENNVKEIESDVQYCTALLKIVTGFPTLKNLSGIFPIGNTYNEKNSSYGYMRERGFLFITAEGLKERITQAWYSDRFMDSDPLDDESNARIVPLSEFESMIGKYSLNFDGLNKVVNKIANQLGEE